MSISSAFPFLVNLDSSFEFALDLERLTNSSASPFPVNLDSSFEFALDFELLTNSSMFKVDVLISLLSGRRRVLCKRYSSTQLLFPSNNLCGNYLLHVP